MNDIELIKAQGIQPVPMQDDGVPECVELAYIIPMGAYVMRGPSGSWDFDAYLGREAARQHLMTLGYGPKRAMAVLQRGQHITAHGMEFDPRANTEFIRDGRQFLNVYQKPAIRPAAGGWDTIRYIIDTVTVGDREGAEWLLNWFACIYQNPGQQMRGAVVIQSATGTGKSLLANLFMELLGRRNCAEVGQDAIESQFNSQFADKIFVLADEVVNSDNRISAKNKLKRYISDPTIDINKKGVPQYTVRNRMNWLFTSNDLMPVRFSGKDDRHYSAVFANPRSGRQIIGHAERLGALFAGGDYSALGRAELSAWAHHLASRAVDWQRAHSLYDNDARNELADNSRNSAEMYMDKVKADGIDALVLAWLADLPKGSQVPDWSFAEGYRVASAVVWESYKRFCKDCNYMPMGRNKFYQYLKQDWPKVDQRIGGDGRLPVFEGMPRSKNGVLYHVTRPAILLSQDEERPESEE